MTNDPARTAPNDSRRRFVATLALAAGASRIPARADAARAPAVDAIAFDAFPVFDFRSIAAIARTHFPDKGAMLASTWSSKLFGYTWLLTAAGRYRPFSTVAEAALRFTAKDVGVTLSADIALDLLDAYSHLDAWADVKPALARLRAAGVRLALLSNLGDSALEANLRNAGIEDYFEHRLSTDRVRRFKPAPEAYAMALDAFRLPKGRIGFAAFGGWDAVGASWFGYRTAWINRVAATAEALDPAPAYSSNGIDAVLSLAGLS